MITSVNLFILFLWYVAAMCYFVGLAYMRVTEYRARFENLPMSGDTLPGWFLPGVFESEIMKKALFARLAVISAVTAGATGSAMAALPEAVTTAVTTAQTDLLALFGALTTAGVAIWVGKLIYNRFKPQ